MSNISTQRHTRQIQINRLCSPDIHIQLIYNALF